MIIIFIISIILILIDQFSKKIIEVQLLKGESIEIINNFFNITSHRNKGAAWGILENSRYFFIVATILFLALIIYYLYKNKKNLKIYDYILFSFIIGGAVGNFIDRLIRREVVDFLDFNILGYSFPIFNFADIFICFGVFLFCIKIYKE